MLRILCFFFLCLFQGISGFADPSCVRTKIKVVVFDFGDVVVRSDKNLIVEFLRAHLKISKPQALELLNQFNALQKEGKSAEVFWRRIFQNLNLQWDPKFLNEFEQALTEALKPISGMLNIVRELQKQDIQTAMLSNTTPFHAKIIRKLGYYKWFSPVLLSYEIGAAKPERRAYEILLEAVDRPAYECLFIDDKLANVETARSLGIDSIHFQSAEQLKHELIKRGIHLISRRP